jgi:hypothetical protein
MCEGPGGRERAFGGGIIVALLLLGGCAGTSAHRAAKPSHGAATAAQPGIFCGRAALRGAQERYRPAQIACLTADGSEFLAGIAQGAKRPGDLVWTRFTKHQADGHGYLWRNACRPTCATGKFFPQPVSVHARDPHNGWFTQLVVASAGGSTPGPAAVTYTLDLKAAQWVVTRAPAPLGGPSVQHV